MVLPRRAYRRHVDAGASAVEYALLVAAVAAVLLAVVLGVAGIVKDALQTTTDCVNGTGTACPTAPSS